MSSAPELRVERWIDGAGEYRPPLTLNDLGDGLKVIYCFQYWCPGCHSDGFPTLKRLVSALGSQGVGFAVVQTVFEGFEKNTFEKLREMQVKYDLEVPFGHDGEQGQEPTIMKDYQTRGTPWFIILDGNNDILFSDFHLDSEKLIKQVPRRSMSANTDR